MRNLVTPKFKTWKRWTEEDKKILNDLYPKVKAAEIAKILNRPIDSVYHYGVKKSRKYTHYGTIVRINEASIVDKAYLAGIIDGEGTVGLRVWKSRSNTAYTYPRITVVNTNAELITWVSNIFNSKIVAKNQHLKTSKKSLYNNAFFASKCGKIAN